MTAFAIPFNESIELLTALSTRREYLEKAVQHIVRWSGCRCVGIRLIDSSGRMPYETFTGFTLEFWEKEKELLVECDSCACTRICTGRLIPTDIPVITCGGSFVTGNLPGFAATLTETDLPNYRGACIGEGFATIGVIPIRRGERTLGIIHLADERHGVLPPEKIEFFEGVSAVIAEVVYRYEVEESLKVAEQRQARIFQQTREVLYTATPEGVFTAINHAGEDLLGYRAAELAGMPLSSLFVDVDQGESVHERILREGFVADHPAELRTRRGESLPVLLSASVIHGDDEQAGIVGAIRKSTPVHELRTLALEAAELGAWEYMIETGRVYWDERCRRQWGILEGDNIDYRDAMMRMDPDDAAATDEAVRNAIHGVKNGVYNREFRVRWPDGSIHWIASHGRVYFEGAGNERRPVRFIGVNRDITRQKEEQELVRQAHARVEKLVEERTADLQEKTALLRTVLETLPVGVALMDAEGRLQYANEAMTSIWDGIRYVDLDSYHEYRVYRQGTDEALPLEEYPAYRALRGKPDIGNIYDIITFREKRRTVAISAAPICLEGKERSGVVLVIEDLTKQQELQKQLHHAQKLESVGALAGGIAHDFNNILMAICGFAEQVYEDLQDEELRKNVRQVLRGGERARELTQKLLAFSRQQVTETEVTSITRIVSAAISFVSRIIGEDIEIVQDLSAGPLFVKGNPGQIEQVLMNVMVNARDAMPAGGVLQIATGSMTGSEARNLDAGADENISYGYIRIGDTGIGIPQQNLVRIFEPYFTTKETGRGTGLGLAIAYGIIRRHDGIITVSSTEGKGTTFSILLPLTAEQEKPEEKTPTMEVTKGTETVLVVEDDPSIRAYLGHVLKKSGYEVLQAENGEQALALLPHHTIEVVLSDVIMPKMNGMEMYLEMKKVRPDLKVIFASGYSSDILDSRGIDSDRLRFLQKPVLKEGLLRALREVLEAPAQGVV